jgi:hypothetical protein
MGYPINLPQGEKNVSPRLKRVGQVHGTQEVGAAEKFGATGMTRGDQSLCSGFAH